MLRFGRLGHVGLTHHTEMTKMVPRKLGAIRAAETVEKKSAKIDREFAALPNSLCLRCDNDFFGLLFLVNSDPVMG